MKTDPPPAPLGIGRSLEPMHSMIFKPYRGFRRYNTTMIVTLISVAACVSAAQQSLGAQDRPAPNSSTEVPMVPGRGEAWLDAVEATFDADVLPSSAAAGRALGAKLAAALNRPAGDSTPAPAVELTVAGKNVPDGTAKELVDVLRGKLDGTDVRISEPGAKASSSDDGNTIHIKVNCALQPDNTPDAQEPRVQLYVLRARFAHGGAEEDVEARFVEKPWVEGFAAYVSQRPGRHWVLARSSEFCTSQIVAKDRALRDAARQLAERVSQTIEMWHERRPWAEWQAGDQSAIENELIPTIREGQFVVDEFAQRLSRPYGGVWRHAILLEVDSEGIQQIARSIAVSRKMDRRARFTGVILIAAVLAVVAVVYFLMNSVTKGYYSWPLRIMSVVAIGGVVVLFMLLA